MAGTAIYGRCTAGFALVALLLSGCAGGSPPPPRAAQNPLTGASLQRGVVVAVRPIDISGQAGARLGLDAVLAALRQPASNGDISGQEIVIRRDDGNPVSIVEQQGAAPGFGIGDQVTIAEGGTTALDHGD